ncbi:uncharacterized protein PSFLO_00776 [Pseudozyma flocculosa]|uniref:Uncharacterized protein n=1 Tax=Pseudozyma flocculosa TaxID=84751 RepID=A0A5C3EUE8_9BASI|nr:uncharacterized protein PSFLO_00776 [Pseudozyma flocculosa]
MDRHLACLAWLLAAAQPSASQQQQLACLRVRVVACLPACSSCQISPPPPARPTRRPVVRLCGFSISDLPATWAAWKIEAGPPLAPSCPFLEPACLPAFLKPPTQVCPPSLPTRGTGTAFCAASPAYQGLYLYRPRPALPCPALPLSRDTELLCLFARSLGRQPSAGACIPSLIILRLRLRLVPPNLARNHTRTALHRSAHARTFSLPASLCRRATAGCGFACLPACLPARSPFEHAHTVQATVPCPSLLAFHGVPPRYTTVHAVLCPLENATTTNDGLAGPDQAERLYVSRRCAGHVSFPH